MEKKSPCQVEIPQNLISEVDRVVLETGLYSDSTEFVFDAVRRLILENSKNELDWVTSGGTNQPRENDVKNGGPDSSDGLYPYGKSRPTKTNKR